MALRNHVTSLTEFSWNTNPKWPVIVWVFKFLRGSVGTEKIWNHRGMERAS